MRRCECDAVSRYIDWGNHKGRLIFGSFARIGGCRVQPVTSGIMSRAVLSSFD